MPAVVNTMNFLINGKGVIDASLTFEVEQVDVTTLVEPDPSWTFVDAAGHMHAYTKDFALPTLKRVERYVEVVPSDAWTFTSGEDEEDWDKYDEPCGYSVTEYHCRICDEHITPRMRETSGTKYAPGRMSWEVRFRTHLQDGWQPAANDMVSIWTEQDGKVKHFGMGNVMVNRVDSDGFVGGVVVGIGELGTR